MACDQGRSAGNGQCEVAFPRPQHSAVEEGHRLRAPNRPEKSQHYNNRDSNARMKQVEQEVFTVNVVDVVFVTVGPVRLPSVHNGERVALVLETRLSLSCSRAVHFKRVLAAELGAELLVGNATPTVVGRSLRVLC